MPIDSSIYSQFAPAAKSVRDFQDEDLMREARRQGIASNQLAMLGQRQKLDEYQRGVREQETVRNALAGLGSGATDDQRIAALKGTGLASGFTQADALQTSLLNRGKTEAETRAKQAESLGKLLSAQGDLATRVFANPTREAAASALANMKSLSQALGIPLDFAGDDAALQQFQTPDQIKAWAAGHAMKAQELLPKIQTLNVGNAQVTQAVDPLTGKPTQTGRMAIAQSPDNAATVGATIRGQNMTDARARETLAETRRNNQVIEGSKEKPKPLPSTALKLQNEELEALGTFKGLDSDLAALQEQIASGKLKPGLVSNAVGSARNAVGLSNEESRNLASFKSKLENMRNAVLLLNKGVQTEGDAQRAMNELMSNINDPGVVSQRLEEIRALNKRAADLRKLNVQRIRQDSNAPEMDFSPYEDQPKALNLPKQPGKTASGATASNW